jgi:hypothetical protein
VNSGGSSSSTIDLFSVFDALTVAASGTGDDQAGGSNPVLSRRPSAGVPSTNSRDTNLVGGRIANPFYDRMPTRGTSEPQTTAIDAVIGTLGDAKADNTLIGDLAFEQVQMPGHRLRVRIGG